jgi:hypothetical protein
MKRLRPNVRKNNLTPEARRKHLPCGLSLRMPNLAYGFEEALMGEFQRTPSPLRKRVSTEDPRDTLLTRSNRPEPTEGSPSF